MTNNFNNAGKVVNNNDTTGLYININIKKTLCNLKYSTLADK